MHKKIRKLITLEYHFKETHSYAFEVANNQIMEAAIFVSLISSLNMHKKYI